MERDDKYFKLTQPILLSVAITLMKAALPKRWSFILAIISVELTTFPLLIPIKATQEAPFICTKIPTINYELETLILLTPKQFFPEVIP